MDEDAKKNIDWQQCCILPSEDYIINHCRVQDKKGRSDITLASSGEAQEEKRCNTGTDPSPPAPMTGQDELLLGAEASGLQLRIPQNVRGRSRSPADQQHARLAALATQMAKEKEEHERRMAAQRQQIAAMGRQVQDNKRMRQPQKKKRR